LVPVVAQGLLFTLLTGMAASVDTAALRERFRRGCGLFLGLLCQFLLLPFTGYLTVLAFDLPPVFGIALLAVSSSPGGAYSNWWCSLFNADLALSVAMTTCSTLVSVVLTPVNLALYMHITYGEVPALNWGRLVGSIAVAIVAILMGLGISTLFPQRRQHFNALGNVAGLALIVFSGIVSSSNEPIWDKDAVFYIAVSLPCIIGLFGSFTLSWLAPCLSGPEAVAVTMETCYQNTGLALTIALASFDESDRSKAAGVPLFYGCVQVVVLPGFLVLAWRAGLTYAPKTDSLHQVIIRDYQPRGGPQVAPEQSDPETELRMDPEDFAARDLETAIAPQSAAAGRYLKEVAAPMGFCSSGTKEGEVQKEEAGTDPGDATTFDVVLPLSPTTQASENEPATNMASTSGS